jgi:hypothetical protein
MTDQSVSVSNMPEPGSKHRVAFDLLVRIANREATPSAEEARDYYLKLYSECRKVVY